MRLPTLKEINKGDNVSLETELEKYRKIDYLNTLINELSAKDLDLINEVNELGGCGFNDNEIESTIGSKKYDKYQKIKQKIQKRYDGMITSDDKMMFKINLGCVGGR